MALRLWRPVHLYGALGDEALRGSAGAQLTGQERVQASPGVAGTGRQLAGVRRELISTV